MRNKSTLPVIAALLLTASACGSGSNDAGKNVSSAEQRSSEGTLSPGSGEPSVTTFVTPSTFKTSETRLITSTTTVTESSSSGISPTTVASSSTTTPATTTVSSTVTTERTTVTKAPQNATIPERSEWDDAFDLIPVQTSTNDYDSATMRYSWSNIGHGCRVREAVLIYAVDEADETVDVDEDCTIQDLQVNEPYTGTVYEYDRVTDGNTVRLDIEHLHPWSLIVEGMSPDLYSVLTAGDPDDIVENLYNWDPSLNEKYGLNIVHSNLAAVDPTGNRSTHSARPLNDGWIGELANGDAITCWIARDTLYAVADMNAYLSSLSSEYSISMTDAELLWLDLTLQGC